jgi:hypothetical protein
MMSKIYEDEQGLYAKVGGYVVRPAGPTKFTKGDTPAGHHFGGSTLVGMGKAKGRAKYEEYWRTPGHFIKY